MNTKLNPVTTTTQRECRILEFVFKFLAVSHVRGLIPCGLRNLKVLFCLVLIKFNICFLKDSKVSQSRIFRSSLFHSLIADGKEEFFEEIMRNYDYLSF